MIPGVEYQDDIITWSWIAAAAKCRLWLSLGQISTSETMLMDCGLMDLIPTRIPYLIIPLELYDRSLLWQRVYYTHREINKRNPYQIEEELHWFDLCLPCSCTRSLLSDISSYHITQCVRPWENNTLLIFAECIYKERSLPYRLSSVHAQQWPATICTPTIYQIQPSTKQHRQRAHPQSIWNPVRGQISRSKKWSRTGYL